MVKLSKNIVRAPAVTYGDVDYSAVDSEEYMPIEGCDSIRFKYLSVWYLQDRSDETDYDDYDECARLATEYEEVNE